ncbi:hypothetical protein BST81_02745 [Leptolyngbya sp. 'hensonii']|uniref:hypothetical protein n=1 Tax=Leptolyngbya sp. 'hensonii' TaxID=1922337 RepID=UPI00095011FE|nr:hypothetical protein [Leptolyngbya sp. 'hensonii']OLP20008.1 hypothetical protein BST81_02745 [Leptolyngbya sp. 'hensonii']
MKSFNHRVFQVGQNILVGVFLSIGSTATVQLSASAQPAYGSYIGVGPSFGVTQGGAIHEGRQIAAVVAARYKFLELPLSARVQGMFFSGTTAIIPTVSYDIPLNWQTDVYIGAGYSFSDGGSPSPVGNRSTFVIQPGIDIVLPGSDFVIFGNAIYAIDAYKSGGGAVALQGGVGIRF